MDKIENLQKYFQEFGCVVEDNGVLDKCIELCNLYNVDEEKLVEMWLGYSTSVFNEVDITLDRLIKLEHDLLKKENKSNNVNRNGEFLNTRSIVTDPLKQIIESDNILEMYGCDGIKTPTTIVTKCNIFTILADISILFRILYSKFKFKEAEWQHCNESLRVPRESQGRSEKPNR
ncbi:hypothetical protein HZH66_009551 [Vespula vulgaris]|uniref:DNA polymerase alpha subunit B N-terminal domain-containing protein n=1 Tax=Vespula vulgaris TaxID=7454 RepID=A0A834JM72_VESVU|nr:hypothetical protein HZH66_009551 [Vespula vulgaris]